MQILTAAPQAGAMGFKPEITQLPTAEAFPADSTLPVALFWQIPSDWRMMTPTNQASQPDLFNIALDSAKGLTPVRLAFPGADSQGLVEKKALVLLYLKVADGAEQGPLDISGKVFFVLQKDGETKRITAPFSAQMEISAKGDEVVPVNPQMLKALNISLEQTKPAKATEPDRFAGMGFAAMLALVFLGGLALNLTPCVYPLIPITISYFAGASDGKKPVARALAYWAGMAVMYSGVGSFVALSGSFLGEALSHPVVPLIIASIMITLALSMFGLWEIRLPASLNRLAGTNREGVIGAFVMGLTLGLIAAPCIGPFVLALITHVAAKGDVLYGFTAFLALSAGLGLPLAVLAVFSGSIGRLPGAGEWMIWVRKVFGLVLLVMALYVLIPLLGETIWLYASAALTALGAIYLGFIDKSGNDRKSFVKIKYLLAIAALVGAGLFVWLQQPSSALTHGEAGEINWQPYSHAALAEAMEADKPVIIDFSADWCAPCRMMENTTFKDGRVIQLMSEFAAFKVDVTRTPEPDGADLVRRWSVRGVPTVVFLDRKGEPIESLTQVGYMDAEGCLARLNAAKDMR